VRAFCSGIRVHGSAYIAPPLFRLRNLHTHGLLVRDSRKALTTWELLGQTVRKIGRGGHTAAADAGTSFTRDAALPQTLWWMPL